MAKRQTEQPRCYYCRRFIAWVDATRSWRLIQAPGVADPEPYEIYVCVNCDA
jgi:hypothetical protein